ncbi:hypothetical protein BS78_02G327100 [Paspalum vaginatum]|nr:hypothetical protein BS78_02G327100 [Paspalum vaginatum]KAJ1291591.1 hypothetical protein BS78_02G327100 [Paspalum vaginatum]KAJ1291596.1 hypothetical protein BS78_02G327100 [Paspalum vaginatum]
MSDTERSTLQRRTGQSRSMSREVGDEKERSELLPSWVCVLRSGEMTPTSDGPVDPRVAVSDRLKWVSSLLKHRTHRPREKNTSTCAWSVPVLSPAFFFPSRLVGACGVLRGNASAFDRQAEYRQWHMQPITLSETTNRGPELLERVPGACCQESSWRLTLLPALASDQWAPGNLSAPICSSLLEQLGLCTETVTLKSLD